MAHFAQIWLEYITIDDRLWGLAVWEIGWRCTRVDGHFRDDDEEEAVIK